MKFLQLLLLVGVLWTGETAVITNSDAVLLLINKDTSCTAVVFKPGLAITDASCAKEGDDVKLCKRGTDNGKDCEEGASVEVDSILNSFPGVTLIKLKGNPIKPLPTNEKILTVGTSCKVIGFGHTQTGLDKEIVWDTPQTFATTIKEIQNDNIELSMEAPSGICKGDQGGAVICEHELAGILPEKGSCVGSTIKVTPLFKLSHLIARQDGEEAKPEDSTTPEAASTTQKKNAAPYMKGSFMAAAFPVMALTLLFP